MQAPQRRWLRGIMEPRHVDRSACEGRDSENPDMKDGVTMRKCISDDMLTEMDSDRGINNARTNT